LQAVIAQILVARSDKPGRVALHDIMINTPSISALIRDNKTFRIPSDQQTGAKYGMITLDANLLDKYERGWIKKEEVINRSIDPASCITKMQEMDMLKAAAEAAAARSK
jgi:twitching motility protein PilT